LNYEIDGNKRDPKEVVKEWLGSRGFWSTDYTGWHPCNLWKYSVV